MNDEEFRTILTIQLLQLQIQIDVLRNVLAEKGVSSEEHVKARNYDFLTQHAPSIAQRIRDDIGGYLEIVRSGRSVQDMIVRLTEEHQKMMFPKGGGG
jgi:hypothetical protein